MNDHFFIHFLRPNVIHIMATCPVILLGVARVSTVHPEFCFTWKVENYWVRPQTCTFILIFVCVSLTILSLVSRKRTLLLSSKYLDVLRQSFGKLMTWLCYFNVWISVYKKKRGERQLVTLMVVHFLVKRRFLLHIILSTCKCKWRKIDTCTSVIIMWPLFFFLFLFLFVSFFVI